MSLFTSFASRRTAMLGIVTVVALLTGCASAGTEQLKDASNATIQSQIVEHKSTKDDVRAVFGGPSRVGYTSDRHEVWVYAFAHARPTATSFIPVVSLFSQGADIRKKLLIVKFDENGVVAQYEYSESTSKSRQGIAE